MSPIGVSFVDAIEAVKSRSLAVLCCDMAKLISLAGTRDFARGQYYDAGLTAAFGSKLAELSLEHCHREIFELVSTKSIRNLVEEIEIYIRSLKADPETILNTWQEIQSYRVLIPRDCNPIARQLFFSNFNAALAVVEGLHRSGTLE